VPFLFDVDGETWTSEDYTLDEMVEVERRAKVKWVFLDPVQEREVTRAFIVVRFARSGSVADAEKRAGALTEKQIGVRQGEDDRPTEFRSGVPMVDPPPATAAPATT
jgi:hypothetical protein